MALSLVDSASYKKALSVMAATYERDKFCKILQYWYRFLSWRATNDKRAKDGANLMKISSNVSLARKVLDFPFFFFFFSKKIASCLSLAVSGWVFA